MALLLAASGCGRRSKDSQAPDGPATDQQRDRYIQKAIRSSSEGVILLPSKRAEAVFELPRLNEIAQSMRRPMAACFLRRAVLTMERTGDPERPWAGIPEGQLKIRARVNPSGDTVRAEVLETGFADDAMEPCLTDVVRAVSWPPNESGNNHFIDIVYWVSLGLQGDIYTEMFKDRMKREQVAAGVKAKQCLQGRVDAGTYAVHGLNLVNHEGATMANRVDHETLPDSIRTCIAKAMQSIRLPREADAFVRPVSPEVTFVVSRDGTVDVEGEAWLKMVELEDRARAARKRAELTGDDGLEDDGTAVVDELPAHRPEGPATGAAGATDTTPVEPEPEPAKDEPKLDPGKGGLRLDLGGGRD